MELEKMEQTPENPPSLHQKRKQIKTVFGDKDDVLTKFWPKKMIQSCYHRVIKNSLCRVANDITKSVNSLICVMGTQYK